MEKHRRQYIKVGWCQAVKGPGARLRLVALVKHLVMLSPKRHVCHLWEVLALAVSPWVSQ
jgi:hypothetical protein